MADNPITTGSITTEKREFYIWTCPECGKKVEAATEMRMLSLAKQHFYAKHD